MLLSFDPKTRTVKAGIRELLSFGWLPERLFREPEDASLQSRQAIHSAYQRSVSGAGTRREVPVAMKESFGGYTFEISGRIDLLADTEGGLEVTEVKTIQGLAEDVDPVEDHVEHVLQLYFYFLALAEAEGDRPITTRLVFLDMDASPPAEKVFIPDPSDPRIASAWHSLLSEVALWLDAELDLRERQRSGLSAFTIPFEDLRPGQAEMAELASETISSGGTALVEAPTGTARQPPSLPAHFPRRSSGGLPCSS
jgi:hypothetical protein